MDLHLHIVGLSETHGPDEAALRLLPPCPLLLPVAVPACSVTAFEADHHDAVAVGRASPSRPQVADRTPLEVTVPDLEASVEHIGPIGCAFDHLDEHGFPLLLDVIAPLMTRSGHTNVKGVVWAGPVRSAPASRAFQRPREKPREPARLVG